MIFIKNVEFSPYYEKLISNGIVRFLKENFFDEIFSIINCDYVVNNGIKDRNGNLHSEETGQFISKNIDVQEIKNVPNRSGSSKNHPIKNTIGNNNSITNFSKDFKGLGVTNSKYFLEDAIYKNKIYYENGFFKSENNRFSNVVANELEKLGAVYTTQGYKLSVDLIPIRVQQALDIVKARTVVKIASLLKLLETVTISTKDLEKYILQSAEKGFEKLQKDILESAKEKKLPVIELDIKNPNPTDINELENYLNYFEERYKGSEQLREKIEQLKQDYEFVDIKTLDKAIQKGEQPEDTQAQKKAIRSQLEQAKEKLREYEKETQKNAPDKPKFKGNKMSVDIAKDYTYNMKFWVKKWSDKEIIQMRKDILEFQKKGIRQEQIKKYFQDRWHIAKDKARFLSKNECGLASTAIKLARYTQYGCTHFKWLHSTSREKRKLHEQYYGKVFSIDNPPIIDERTGQKGFPKQIYNCSCSFAPAFAEESINGRKNTIINVINAVRRQFKNNTYQYRRYSDG